MTPTYFLGIDIAAETFTATVFTPAQSIHETLPPFANVTDGFDQFHHWLHDHHISPQDAVICLEATGVYGEAFCYYFTSQGYRVAVEPPLKVKRAFHPHSRKTDAVDSKQIAEYAYRFYDQLSFWLPAPERVEHIRTLLALRERLVKQLTAHKNAQRGLERKPLKTSTADKITDEMITFLQQKIVEIEQELKTTISNDSSFRHFISNLDSIPGVGMLLASYFLTLTNGFTKMILYRPTASYLGICPLEHTSGTSVRSKPRSRRFGPPEIRKLLHLAARSVCTHNAQFRAYFLRKVAEGKPERVIFNNVANKLVKIICAVIQSGQPFSPTFRSFNPALLKNLT